MIIQMMATVLVALLAAAMGKSMLDGMESAAEAEKNGEIGPDGLQK